ncbi:MAG: AAA family ATPase, partial [Vicinamibacteria bacterium]
MTPKRSSRSKSGAIVPRFGNLRVENWRNFGQFEVELERRVFLVGPNASGKSNFLDVFRFLHDIASPGGGLQDSVGRRCGVSSLRSLAARRYSDILVGVEVRSNSEAPVWRYELQFSQDNLQRATIKREQVWKDGVEILNRPDSDDGDDPERLTQTYLEQVNVNRPFRELAEFFATIRYLHILPQLVREHDRSLGRRNDPYGGDFLEQIAATQE